jgi:putative membrane-bound dehydrogenase-like protein
MTARSICVGLLILATVSGQRASAQRPAERVPGAPMPAGEAAARMTVPDGFKVTLFAAEPDVRQPIAMTLDHRGRLWVAENFSYPGWLQPAQENDRIVIFEYVDGDGRFDSRTVFWDQGKTVTGLAIGFGGVWVCATPYLLFIPDCDGDDRPDAAPTVVLDGWDVKAQHNLFNALNWGPDGWLYGCNGILSNSRVGQPGTPDEQRVAINCGVWRFHPTTKAFEAVAHGTTNPWGLDFDDYGALFITNCVIPHLFHVVTGARFVRMYGEDFNRHSYELMPTCADHLHWNAVETWSDIRKLGVSSITDRAGGGHAHTGAMIYLGDNWPASYRNSVFTCNIHGHRVNHDRLEPHRSGYVARHQKDFLLGNDPWFRGMELRYGPDGGVYLSDWSDIGECHETDGDLAHRENGRIYKITFGDVKPVRVDLSKLDSVALAALQSHPNDWFVRQGRRLLQERATRGDDMAAAREALLKMFQEANEAPRALRALWALQVTGGLGGLSESSLLAHPSEHVRSWAIRLYCEGKNPSDALLAAFEKLAATDPSPRVRLTLASVLQRIPLAQGWEIARGLVAHSEDESDANLPLMTWYALEPRVAADPSRACKLFSDIRVPLLRTFVARRLIQVPGGRGGAELVRFLAAEERASLQRDVLAGIDAGLRGQKRALPPAGWPELFARLERSDDSGIRKQANLLALRFGDPRAGDRLAATMSDAALPVADRREALEALTERHEPGLPARLLPLLDDPAVRGPAIRALAAYRDPAAPSALVKRYRSFAAAERDDAIGTLASRPSYASALLDAIERGEIPARDVSVTIARQIQALGHPELSARLASAWGTLRPTSGNTRALLARYQALLNPDALARADAASGRQVFQKTCAQCHKLFGEGGDLGPELTGADRKNVEYILQNVLDPSATVGKDYRLTTVAVRDGRIVSGIIKSQTDRILVVQTVNDRLAIDRDDVEELKVAESSVMPEGLFQKLSDAEIRGLRAYLAGDVQAAPESAGR